MSGHSKWSNIKHRKGKNDALKAKVTTKISREITVAVKAGGTDPTGNMRLKLALQKARENNIPRIIFNVPSIKVPVQGMRTITKKLPMKDMVQAVLLSL